MGVRVKLMAGVRKTYYNPKLDPDNKNPTPEDLAEGGPLLEPTEEHKANLVSSLCEDGYHYPAIDIDVPCRLEKSNRNYHLYFDETKLNWDQYVKLLQAFVDAGLMEIGYMKASLNDGQTLLRPPGYPKFNHGASDRSSDT